MFPKIYRFLSEMYLTIKFMSVDDFEELLKKCDYEQMVYIFAIVRR